jgi:hypothetical protein
MTPDVAVVIPLKLVYTPVDDTVTAPLCSTSTSTGTGYWVHARTCVLGACWMRGTQVLCGYAAGVGATTWVRGGGAWRRGWAESVGRVPLPAPAGPTSSPAAGAPPARAAAKASLTARARARVQARGRGSVASPPADVKRARIFTPLALPTVLAPSTPLVVCVLRGCQRDALSQWIACEGGESNQTLVPSPPAVARSSAQSSARSVAPAVAPPRRPRLPSVRKRNQSSPLARRACVGRHARHGRGSKTAFIATVKQLVPSSIVRTLFV